MTDPKKTEGVTAADLLRWIDQNPHPASWVATAKDIREIVDRMPAHTPDTLSEGGGEAFTVDEIAQEIRRVDGNHDLGAGALAEALTPFLLKKLLAYGRRGRRHGGGAGTRHVRLRVRR